MPNARWLPAWGGGAMKKNYATRIAVAVGLLAAYLLLYFASVMDGQFKATPDPRYMRTYGPYAWFAAPYYRGFPGPVQGVAQWAFTPAHYLDRHLFRPGKWAGWFRFPAAPKPAKGKR